jgi:hypothetical protein
MARSQEVFVKKPHRFSGNTWFAGMYQRMAQAFRGRALNVQSPWVPKPASWVWRSQKLRLFYTNEVLYTQLCSDLSQIRQGYGNKFHHGVINVSAPRGMRRSDFEADMRHKIEGELRREGMHSVTSLTRSFATLAVSLVAIGIATYFMTKSPSSATLVAALALGVILAVACIFFMLALL